MSTPLEPSQSIPGSKQCLDALVSTHNSDVETPAAHNDEDDSAAESDDSKSTQEESVEAILAEAAAARQQKIHLGGRPTRSIKKYCPEDVNLIPMADDHPRAKQYHTPARPILQRIIPWEETLYRTYCAEERMHFRSELLAWEVFLRSIRRDWVKRNEAAGGTIPPPPPVLEWDPLDLHTRYSEFLSRIKIHDETEHQDFMMLSRFNFWPYHVFVDHIDTVERQVAEMREEQALVQCPSTGVTEPEPSQLCQAGTQGTQVTSSPTTKASEDVVTDSAPSPKPTDAEIQLETGHTPK